MEQPASLREYVEAQDRLDREARDMFPYDFSTCSIEQGYVKQQVFACRTCTPAGDAQPGGVCYSCSITCHGEHELVELFNRRAFKCDCGSARMGDTSCCITKNTRAINQENTYNDNYKNIFCFCKQQYDAATQDATMYQCLLCEDWFHDECIRKQEGPLPNDELFEHYLCRDCTDKEPWLRRYRSNPRFHVMANGAPSVDREVQSTKRPLPDDDDDGDDGTEKELCPPHKIRAVSVDGELARKTSEPSSSACRWKCLPEVVAPQTSLFLPEDFREEFCPCQACNARLARLPALAEEEEVYDPPEDEEDAESTFDAGTRAMESTLSALPRDKAIEGLLAYNKLKDHISACLKPLAEKGEIVTSQHVREFFSK